MLLKIIKKIQNLYRREIWTGERYARYQGVKVGKNCDIQKVSFGSEPYLVTIGDHVQITGGTKIYTHGGGWVLRDKHPEFDFFGKVTIKNNVYIGNNCLIMPGVTIGNNVIVAAGSVVTKSIPDNNIIGGNPAKIIGTIVDFESRMLPYNVKSKQMTLAEKKSYLLTLSEDRFIKKKMLS